MASLLLKIWLICLLLIVMPACTNKKTKQVNDVIHGDPKQRIRAIEDLKAKPDMEVISKLSETYKHGQGETKLRAGHALLEIYKMIEEKKKEKESQNSAWNKAASEGTM